jgi:hypothetical protein
MLTGLITFWALMIAAYSILPEYWKFKLKAFVGMAWTALAFGFSSILVFWSMLVGENGFLVPLGRDYSIVIFPAHLEIAAYIVLSLYVLSVFLLLKYSRVTTRNLSRFQELVSSLIVNRQTDLLSTVLRDNSERLALIYDSSIIKKGSKKATTGLSAIFPSEPTELEATISGLFDRIISDEELTRSLVRYDVIVPLMIIKVADNRISAFDLEQYLHFVLKLLISEPGSALYREIQSHQNWGDWARSRDFKGSILLEFLFQDANRAKRLATWKPIGEYVLRYLHDRPGGRDDEYNNEASYFTEPLGKEKFSNPIFVGLEYFDFMVKEAIIQRIEWHMWLYYLRYWVEKIVLKIEHKPDEWQKGYWEYPTKYAFFLYKFVHYQLDWLHFALDNKMEIRIQQGGPHDNSNILKCTAQCIANSLRLICESDKLPDKYKHSLTTPWWDIYFKMKNSNLLNYSDYAEFLLSTIYSEINGDLMQGAFESKPSPRLLGSIVSSLASFDKALGWFNQNTYKERLKELQALVQEHVLPLLKASSAQGREEILTKALGSDFAFSNDDILVNVGYGAVKICELV